MEGEKIKDEKMQNEKMKAMERNHTWAINTEEKYDVSEDSFLFTQFLASEADLRERWQIE